MQKRRRSAPRRVARPATPGRNEHSTSELYLHGLAGIIGLGILILPIFMSLVYSGPFSVYLVIAAGFIALMIAMLIYDISITHSHDPYNFLKATSDIEYSFIFGFLILVSFLITTTAAGIASVGEISQFFGLNIYISIALVDIVFFVMWLLFFYQKTRKSLNFAGALKILFVVLLIVVGTIAVTQHGFNTSTASVSFPSYIIAPFSLALVLFLWMYGGFEGSAIVYKGTDRTKVAKALIYVLFSAIVIFSLIQLLVYGNSQGVTVQSIQFSPISIFTANILSGSFNSLLQDIIVGLSVIVILTMAFAVINTANRTLDDMSRDHLMPSFLKNDENLKLLITAAVPMVLITIFANIITIVPGAVFVYIPIIILAALSFVAAFVFFSIGYGYHYLKNRDYTRAGFGMFVGILLLVLIALSPAAFLVGLVVILAVSVVGYVLLK